MTVKLQYTIWQKRQNMDTTGKCENLSTGFQRDKIGQKDQHLSVVIHLQEINIKSR